MFEPFKRRIHTSRKERLLRLARRLGGPPLLLGLARWFYRLHVDGIENIPAQGGCLTAFNHVSTLADGLVYLTIYRRRPDVALYTLSVIGEVIGGLIQAVGLPSPETRRLQANIRRLSSVDELLRARQVLLQGGCIAIAPEGELTWDGRLQYPLAPGAAWLALRTAAPVIPVISRGGYDVQPLWQIEKIRLTGRISIRAGQPLKFCEQPLDRVTEAHLQAANQQLWEAMTALAEIKVSG